MLFLIIIVIEMIDAVTKSADKSHDKDETTPHQLQGDTLSSTPVPQPNTSRLVKANLRFFVQLNRWVQGNAPQQWMAWKAGTPTQKEISSPKFYLFTPTPSVFSSFFLIFFWVFSTIFLCQNWLTTVLQHNEIFFSSAYLFTRTPPNLFSQLFLLVNYDRTLGIT